MGLTLSLKLKLKLKKGLKRLTQKHPTSVRYLKESNFICVQVCFEASMKKAGGTSTMASLDT